MESVARNIPEAERHVLVIDPADGAFDSTAEPFTVTFGHQLNLPHFSSYAFVNDVLGFCCFLKPVFGQFLLERTKADLIVYADSDVCCYAPPDALVELLQKSPVALTPHSTEPAGPGAYRSDGDLMRSGPFNAGLFACRRCAETDLFLSWWQRAMESERCLDAAIAHDQPWLSLAAVYFPWIAVLRDPGYNVAYWNIQRRLLARLSDGTLTAGGRPLVFFHFSFFDHNRPTWLAHRPPIVIPAEGPELPGLLDDHAKRLEAAGSAACLAWRYAYHFFTDGKAITSAHRQYFLDRAWDEAGPNGNPFDPNFTTENCRGVKAVYAVDQSIPRLARVVNRQWRRLR